MNRDLIAGLIGLALACGYYALASQIQVSQLADEVGPDGLPKIYAWLLGGLSALLVLRAIFSPTALVAHTDGDHPVGEAYAAKRGLGILLIGIAYVIAVPYLGYPLTLAVVIALAALYQGGRLSWQLTAVGICGAAVLWFVFVFLLHIAQPEGLWPELIERLRR